MRSLVSVLRVVAITALAVVVAMVAVADTTFPPGYEAWAWGVAGFLAAVTVTSAVLTVVDFLSRAA
jgi:hypothetical protein